MRLSYRRVDREGVPSIVQWFRYHGSTEVYVLLFNSSQVFLNLQTVRGYVSADNSPWSYDQDFLAIEFYINMHPSKFFKTKEVITDPSVIYQMFQDDEARQYGSY